METAFDEGTKSRRMWISIPAAVLFSVASLFSYFEYMGQAFAVGGWTGLAGREQEIVIAQHRAIWWLLASLVCQAVSAIAFAVALPWGSDAPPSLRLLVRIILGAALSAVFSLVVAIAVVSIATALHRPLGH